MDDRERREKFLEGENHFRQRKYKEALKAFGSVDMETLNSGDVALVNHYLALCHSHLGSFQKSSKHFEEALQHNKEEALISFHYGLTCYYYHEELRREELLRKGKTLIEQAILKREDPEYWYYHGVVAEKLGESERAKKSFRRSLHQGHNVINKEGSKIFEKVRRER